MNVQQKTEVIVLKTHDFGEKDKIVVFLSAGLGKFSAVAKGARKLTGKSMGRMEPMNNLSLMFRRGMGMGVVTQSEALCSFPFIRGSFELCTAALYLLETVYRCTEEKEENPRLYILLKKCLELLENNENPEMVKCMFDIKFLKLTGYEPSLERCANCGVPGSFSFVSYKEGGVLCQGCGEIIGEFPGGALSPGCIKALGFLKIIKPGSISRIKLSGDMICQISGFLREYKSQNLPGYSRDKARV